MMKIWKIQRIALTGYDMFGGFIVRASDEKSARALASDILDIEIDADGATWLDPSLSTCEDVTDGGPKVIMSAFLHG